MIIKKYLLLLILSIIPIAYGNEKIVVDKKFVDEIECISNIKSYIIYEFDWMPNGKELVYICEGRKKIMRFNIETKKEEVLKVFPFEISKISVSSSGKIAYLYSKPYCIVITDAKFKKPQEFKLPQKNFLNYDPYEIKWLPDEKGIVFLFELSSHEGREGHGVAIFDIEKVRIKEIPAMPLDYNYSVALNYNNSKFYIIGIDIESEFRFLLLDPITSILKGTISIRNLPYGKVQSIDSKGENVLLISRTPPFKELKGKHKGQDILWRYNIKKSTLFFLTEGKSISSALYSPDDKKIAFVKNFDLYITIDK